VGQQARYFFVNFLKIYCCRNCLVFIVTLKTLTFHKVV